MLSNLYTIYNINKKTQKAGGFVFYIFQKGRQYVHGFLKSLVFFSLIGSTSIMAKNIAEVYQLSLLNDQQYRASLSEFKAEKETLKQAYSYIKPSVNLNSSYADVDSDIASRTYNSTTADLQVRQSLYNASTFVGIKIAKNTKVIAQLDMRRQEMNLIQRVALGYFNLLRSIEQYQSINTELKAIKKRYEQVDQSYKIGLSARTDVFEAQSQLHILESNKLGLRRNIELAREALFVTANTYIDAINPLAKQLTLLDQIGSYSQLLPIAQQNSPTLLQTQIYHENAKKNTQLKKYSRFPVLNARLNHSSTLSEELTENSVFVDFSMPLYSGGRVSSEIKQAKYQALQAGFNLQYAQRTLSQGLRSILTELQTNIAQIEAYLVAIKSAKAALKATQGGYQSGTRTILELLTSQSQLHQAERNLVNSRIDAVIVYLNLRYHLGLLSIEDIQQVNTQLTGQSIDVQKVLAL